MDEQDKERKEKHKEWMRKKDEEMRRKLMKVYGPTPVFDPCKYCLFYHRFLINLYQLSIKKQINIKKFLHNLGDPERQTNSISDFTTLSILELCPFAKKCKF